MSQTSRAGAHVVSMTLSVPVRGGLRIVATDLVSKIAEYLGAAAGANAALETVANRVAPEGSDDDIAFEFRAEERELVIVARCGGRSSEVRHPLAR